MKLKKWVMGRRGILILLNFMYATPAILGWQYVQGNLSASKWFGIINLSDPLLVLQTFISQQRVSMVVLMGGLIVLGFFFLVGGRSYCSWVCPLHLILEISYYARRLVGWLNFREINICSQVKYWFLLVVVIVSAITGLTAFEVISPIGITSRAIAYGPDIGLTLVAIIVVFDLTFSKGAWCRSCCPLGAFYALVGRVSPLKIKLHKEKCNQCMACKTNCIHQEILDPVINGWQKFVESGECTRCGYCIDDCTLGALKFGLQIPPLNFR
jgi:ferredoxin-type protein NapH